MKWCVYKHVSPSKKVYIGITSRGVKRRWSEKENSYKCNKKFYNALLKYGWDNFQHIVLYDNLNEASAKIIEKDLIYFYKKSGISYNITDGGEGMLGYRVNSNCKPVFKIDPVNLKIIKEYDAVIDAAKELKEDPAILSHAINDHLHKGFLWVFKEDYSNIKNIKFKFGTKKEVVQLDLTKNIVRVYESINAASRATGIDSKALQVAIKRKNKSGEWYWIFNEDLSNLANIKFKKSHTRGITLIKGDEQIRFNTIVEAYTFLGYKTGFPVTCVKNKFCKGYILEYDI